MVTPSNLRAIQGFWESYKRVPGDYTSVSFSTLLFTGLGDAYCLGAWIVFSDQPPSPAETVSLGPCEYRQWSLPTEEAVAYLNTQIPDSIASKDTFRLEPPEPQAQNGIKSVQRLKTEWIFNSTMGFPEHHATYQYRTSRLYTTIPRIDKWMTEDVNHRIESALATRSFKDLNQFLQKRHYFANYTYNSDLRLEIWLPYRFRVHKAKLDPQQHTVTCELETGLTIAPENLIITWQTYENENDATGLEGDGFELKSIKPFEVTTSRKYKLEEKVKIQERCRIMASYRNFAKMDTVVSLTESTGKFRSTRIEEARGPFSMTNPQPMPVSTPIDPKSVFVIYGRNTKLTKSIFQLLREFGLEPKEWGTLVQGTGYGSPETLEVVRKGLASAAGIVSLWSGDDFARMRPECRDKSKNEGVEGETPQARQNVILETGLALAMKPGKVILVRTGPAPIRSISDLAGLNFLPIIDQKGRKDTPARKNLLDRLKAIGVGVDVDGKTMWMNAGTFRDSISPSASPKAQPKVPKNGLVFTDDAGKCWWRLTPIGGAVVTIEGVMMNTFNKELKLVNCRFNPSGDYGEVKVYSDTSNVATQHPLKPDTPKRVGVTWSLKKPPTDEGKNCGCDISFKDHIGGEHTFEVTCSYQPMFSLG